MACEYGPSADGTVFERMFCNFKHRYDLSVYYFKKIINYQKTALKNIGFFSENVSKNIFAETDALGRHFHKFVVSNIFKRLL